MVKSDKSKEIKALKKALSQEKRKNKALEKKYGEEKLKNKLLKCDSKKKSKRIASILSLREREAADGVVVPRHRHDEITIRFTLLISLHCKNSHTIRPFLQCIFLCCYPSMIKLARNSALALRIKKPPRREARL